MIAAEVVGIQEIIEIGKDPIAIEAEREIGIEIRIEIDIETGTKTGTRKGHLGIILEIETKIEIEKEKRKKVTGMYSSNQQIGMYLNDSLDFQSSTLMNVQIYVISKIFDHKMLL
jgi:hypothetical protein